MSKSIILLIISVIFSLTGAIAQADLTITIPNVKNDQGLIQIGIFNKKENFPKEGKEMRLIILKADSPVFVHTEKNLPPGEYAVALMHDENADGVCNLNFLGIPKEGYGFSNNVKPVLSAPSFDAAKIRLDGDISIVIHLIY